MYTRKEVALTCNYVSMQSESGGTVLSTNWNEIGTKKTEIKPPDGMEWKQYPK